MFKKESLFLWKISKKFYWPMGWIRKGRNTVPTAADTSTIRIW